MTISNLRGGELYFIRERDVLTGEISPYVKIGLVRENEAKSSADRTQEHQTGNPRELFLHHVILSPCISYLETTMHGRFEPWRVSGEWFNLSAADCDRAIKEATSYAAQLAPVKGQLERIEEVKVTPTDVSKLDPTEHDLELASTYARAALSMKAIKDVRKEIKDLILLCNQENIDVSDLGKVTFGSRPTFNEPQFKAEHPEIYSQFMKTESEVTGAFRWENALTNSLSLDETNPSLAVLIDGMRQGIAGISSKSIQPSSLIEMIFELKTHEAAATFDKDLAQAELQARCGLATGIKEICTWKRELKTEPKFDRTLFKATLPDLYDAYSAAKQVPNFHIIKKNREQGPANMLEEDVEGEDT